MGVVSKFLAANGLNLGHIESPDFPCCMIQVKNGQPVIIAAALNASMPDYVIDQDQIETFELIGCGGTWAKYRIVFRDGKSGIITQEVLTDRERKERKGNSTISMAPIERYIKEKRTTDIANSGPSRKSSATKETHEEQTVVSEKKSNEAERKKAANKSKSKGDLDFELKFGLITKEEYEEKIKELENSVDGDVDTISKSSREKRDKYSSLSETEKGILVANLQVKLENGLITKEEFDEIMFYLKG